MDALKNTLREDAKGISLGIFAGDHAHFGADLRAAHDWGCKIIHFDVMDGVFVPQFTGGPGFVKALSSENDELIMDVHLMVQNPLHHVRNYVASGADIVTIHTESENAVEAIKALREAAAEFNRAVLVGVSLFPETPDDKIENLFELAPDLILTLAVDPRNGAPADVAKGCARLERFRKRFASEPIIQAFDGGVTLDTIDQIAAAQADLVVSGSAILQADSPQRAFNTMRNALAEN